MNDCDICSPDGVCATCSGDKTPNSDESTCEGKAFSKLQYILVLIHEISFL